MWQFFAILIVSLVVSYALAPRPKSSKPAIGEIKAPTAEEGREIPVLFGTREIKGANVVWYGDKKVVAIRKKSGGK